MIEMLVLVVLIPLAIFVAMIAWAIRLTRRVATLEAQIVQLAALRVPASDPRDISADTVPAPAPKPTPQPTPAPASEIAGLWARAASAPSTTPPTEPATPQGDRPVVLRRDRLVALLRWLRENWAYPVAAMSLALAGIYFVQYGIERGLLPPPARVVAGMLFGAALIAGGEWLRRRFGDEAGDATAYLPSTLSGAGLVAIFAAIAAGRLIYGLYGPALTFAGLLVTAAGAVLLGWRHSPMLAAVGLIGAAAVPFLVGGDAAAPAWLYAHYLLIAAAALAIDAWRRWAWISVLGLVLGHLGMWSMHQSGAGAEGWLLALAALVPLTIILPERALTPRHDGPPGVIAIISRGRQLPIFPVRLAAGNMLVVALTMAGYGFAPRAALLALILLAALTVLLLIWTERASGLDDLAALPGIAFLVRLAFDPWHTEYWLSHAVDLRLPEIGPPMTMTLLMVLAAVMALAAALRSLRGGTVSHALGAAVMAFAAPAIAEAVWMPSVVLGPWPWALHVMVMAAMMVWLAVLFARADGRPGRRSAWAVLAAMSLIALSLFILSSTAALTLALAVLIPVAVALDRRFEMPEMGWFVQLGAAVLTWRLLINPGLLWAGFAPVGTVVMAHLGVTAACIGALRIVPPGRTSVVAVLQSLAGFSAALMVNVLLLRWLNEPGAFFGILPSGFSQSHWAATLNAMPWLLLALATGWRHPATSRAIRILRHASTGFAILLAVIGLTAAVTALNPLFSDHSNPFQMILGPPILDSLALAYALPGVILLLAARRAPYLTERLRQLLTLVGIGLIALYAVAEIRRLWQGRWIGGDTVLQGELYSYTLALLLTGAVLLWQALARRSRMLKRLAMAVIAVTVAKVFLWDAAGLTGLLRVVSFAGLGLSLAGLAWLNRWAGQAVDEGDGANPPPATDP